MKKVLIGLVAACLLALASAVYADSTVEILDRNGNVCHYKVTDNSTGQVTYFYAPCPE